MFNTFGNTMGGYTGNANVGNYTGNYLNAAIDASTGGMVTPIYNAVSNFDEATGGYLGAMQTAAFYPSKMLAEALIGNTELGRSWIDFQEENFTLAGEKRKRDEARLGETMNGDAEKREKVDTELPIVDNPFINREISANKAMKKNTGHVFQPPKSFRFLKRLGLGRVGKTAGNTLKAAHMVDELLNSY